LECIDRVNALLKERKNAFLFYILHTKSSPPFLRRGNPALAGWGGNIFSFVENVNW